MLDGFISIMAFDFHNSVMGVLSPFFNLGNEVSGSFNTYLYHHTINKSVVITVIMWLWG